jgi:hypothetical protein
LSLELRVASVKPRLWPSQPKERTLWSLRGASFVNAPGFEHAANYSGHMLKPAPPVLSPWKIARCRASGPESQRPTHRRLVRESGTIGLCSDACFQYLLNEMGPGSLLQKSSDRAAHRGAYPQQLTPGPECFWQNSSVRGWWNLAGCSRSFWSEFSGAFDTKVRAAQRNSRSPATGNISPFPGQRCRVIEIGHIH